MPFDEILIVTHFTFGVSTVEVLAATATGEASLFEGESVVEAIQMARAIAGDYPIPILITAETKVAMEHNCEKLPWDMVLAEHAGAIKIERPVEIQA